MSPVKLFGALVVAAVVLALTAASAAAQTPIGPNQQFAGAVNGNTTNAKVIMICPGPASPGQTGHPEAGQGVEVVENSGTGFTGAVANRIVATLGPASSTNLTFVFTEYGVPQDIPTTAVLPCSGTGVATFAPQPTSSTARNATVKLQFVNIAV
jgi:hypothetical protein